MEQTHKKLLIKYSVIFSSFLVFALAAFGLSVLAKHFTRLSFETALTDFFKNEVSVSEPQFCAVHITSLQPISAAFANSGKKNLRSLSVEAFLVKHSGGEFSVFIQPVFTDAGLANAVFASAQTDTEITYLGLLGKENKTTTVLDSTIMRAKLKLEKLREAAR